MKAIAIVVFSSALLAGCAAPSGSNSTYSSSSMKNATRTVEGAVVSKRPVKVAGSAGQGVGGLLGAIAGSGVGSGGREHAAGAIVGAIVGGAVGSAVDRNAMQHDAFEYIVRSASSDLLTVIQTDDTFQVGDKVFVVLADKPVLVKSAAR
ncbi:MAG TPA: hypothetical protein VEC06_16170 [Paucimonas sp.]|nr:hypothetical protein [Paucimonas sp.]